MTTLGDDMFGQYGGRVPSDPQSVARDAIQRYGSGRAAARAMGIDEKTIRRWKNGETAKSEHVEKYAQEARRSYADRKEGPIVIKFRYAKRTRDLKFGAGGKSLRAGAEREIREAYIRGDKEGMARAFVGGVDDPWYRRMMRQAYDAELEGETGEAGEDSGAVGAYVSAN